MGGQKKKRPDDEHPHDLSEQIVLKSVKDKSGYRVVLHLHHEGSCVVLEGHARFTTKAMCHEHGAMLHEAINTVIGIIKPTPEPKGAGN